MSTKSSFSEAVNWQEQAYQYLVQGQYSQAASLYEQAIAVEPEVNHYWHLGLLLVLQGQEAEAQLTWLLAIEAAEPEQVDVWTVELMQVLQTEAQRQEALEDYSIAWVIRQHMREVSPSNINNLLQIIHLSVKLERFGGDELTWGVIELLQAPNIDLDFQLLLQVLQDVLDAAPLHPASLELAEACLPYFPNPETCFNILLPAAMKISHVLKQHELAARLVELYLRLGGKNVEALRHLAAFYQNAANYSKGIETARLCYSRSQTLPEKIYGMHLVLRGLLNAGGYWEEVMAACQELESLMLSLTEAKEIPMNEVLVMRLLTPFFSLPHIKDEPTRMRPILNRVAQLFQAIIQSYAQEQTERYYQRRLNAQRLGTSARPLKIGYVSDCLKRHSVGWLARGVFEHHDRDRFQVHTYLSNSKHAGDFIQEWYVEHSCKAYKAGIDALEIAEKIYEDEIDILIDLDSITVDIISKVMALKCAPVQVTWLGWDASGLPAIDYFIADPYVLVESAQDYYTEKIWRLPHTYIAVDGFEVGIPTIRRDQLDIPSDALVYLSAQRGYKRHPDTARLQMKIIKEVPNSYFLIKGLADKESVKSFFTQIAEEEGVDGDRLRFLPVVNLEEVHRANLGIADVVLDTYPYNGATTTLETLWMGIPLVTRVGEQFAARNSYTMMMNVGVTEGIAWTDEEYVEWGVRLGKDSALRQKIAWQLRQSRQTAPLWNAKQFTREMEKAYEEMWQRYVEAGQYPVTKL